MLLLVLKLQVVREGQTHFFGPTRLPMRAGTIITLRDAFFKWPVRRKAANEVPTTIDELQSHQVFNTQSEIERHQRPLLLCAGVGRDVTYLGRRL